MMMTPLEPEYIVKSKMHSHDMKRQAALSNPLSASIKMDVPEITLSRYAPKETTVITPANF